MLLANAVWTPDLDRLEEVAAWCDERRIPPALVLRADDRVGREAARRQGYAAALAFVPAPLTTGAPADGAASPSIEQVGFARGGAVGLSLARHYRQPEQAVAIGGAVADALRRSEDVRAWIAWRPDGTDDEPDGALLAFAPLADAAPAAGRAPSAGAPAWEGLLLAGPPSVQRALRDRFAAEAVSAARTTRLWRARTPRGRLEARAWMRLEPVERGATRR